MKLGIDIFCASQASTAIRLTTMDVQEASSSLSSSSITQLGSTRAIDRHNPIIRDPRRSTIPIPLPCTSQPPPVPPIPYKQLHHKSGRKTSSKSKPNYQNNNSSKKSSVGATVQKKKSKIDIHGGEIVRKSFAERGDFMINGPDSSRYLLGETVMLDLVSDFEPGLELVPVDASNNKTKARPAVKTEQSSVSNSNPPPPPPPSSRSPGQVVVLRVSLHCKGCEEKVRKHISRMQGVTYFNIDFAAKKVTVVGDVTPLGVLSSISKVKTAQLWTPPMPMPMSMPMSMPMTSSLPAAASSSFQEIKKNKAVAAGI